MLLGIHISQRQFNIIIKLYWQAPWNLDLKSVMVIILIDNGYMCKS